MVAACNKFQEAEIPSYRPLLLILFIVLLVGCHYNYKLDDVAGIEPGAVEHNDKVISLASAVFTNVVAFGPIVLIQSGGKSFGPRELAGDLVEIRCRSNGQLDVSVNYVKSGLEDPCKYASWARASFRAVWELAGRPPVNELALYLIPAGMAFSIGRDSWGFGNHHSVAYLIQESEDGYKKPLVRIVAHELFHVWVGGNYPDRSREERAAVTIGKCAQLLVLGRVSRVRKPGLTLTSEQVQQVVGESEVARDSVGAKYGRNETRDLFSLLRTPIKAGTGRAHELVRLCKSRAHAFRE